MTNHMPLSLYIHFPWCIRKCPYCDFNSYKLTTELDEPTYINALIADLKKDLSLAQDREIISIFMGGGTPSLFSPESMERLLTTVRQHLSLRTDCEITMEMNPGAVEHGNLAGYREAGINRLSIGVQSFNAKQLKTLGRVHNNTEAIEIVGKSQQAGFDNINLDLMYALPQQTVEEALDDLQQATQLQTQHLSWYHLTIEPNTEFYRRPPQVPDEDTSIEIEIAGKELLKKSGFDQYEISAFCHQAKQCQHNRNYWEFGDYLGIGAGAHAKITDLETMQITRYWKQRTPRNYLNSDQNFVAGERILTPEDKVTEFMFNTLRLTDGFSAALFSERTGLPLLDIEKMLAKAQKKGFLQITNTNITPTALGLQYLNDMVQLFM
jgi:putative oxygen-independent coproporphyrinogen III oxidase